MIYKFYLVKQGIKLRFPCSGQTHLPLNHRFWQSYLNSIKEHMTKTRQLFIDEIWIDNNLKSITKLWYYCSYNTKKFFKPPFIVAVGTEDGFLENSCACNKSWHDHLVQTEQHSFIPFSSNMWKVKQCIQEVWEAVPHCQTVQDWETLRDEIATTS